MNLSHAQLLVDYTKFRRYRQRTDRPNRPTASKIIIRMVGFIALVWTIAKESNPPPVSEFVRAFQLRKSDVPSNTPDQAIDNALTILLRAGIAGLSKNRNPSERDTDAWVKPYSDAVAEKGDKYPLEDGYRSVDLNACGHRGFHFIVSRMGAVSKAILLDPSGESIRLPKKFEWNVPWMPRPRWLPCGLLLLEESGIEALGIRDGVKLVWLKIQGKTAKQVGSFEGVTTLDLLSPKVVRNRVSIKTLDDPLALVAYPSTTVLERDSTWICTAQGPRLIRSIPAQRPLREVGKVVYRAWHAKKPAILQRRICNLMPRNDPFIENWSERRAANGREDVVVNGVVFDFQVSRSGYRLKDVFESDT